MDISLSIVWRDRVDALSSARSVNCVHKGDTVHVRDTVRDTIPKPAKRTPKRIDTVYLPILIDTTTDRTVEGDSIPVLVPIVSKEYKTDNYRAIVSGYKPSLDFMEVYRDKEIITLSPLQKKKRWGLGLQTGYSYPGGWYVGVGISCNLIMW